jgi:predicted nucleotidyltransferase
MAIRQLVEITDTSKRSILEELKTFLSSRKEIVFALLYGSMVSLEVPQRYGDIDVAIYIESELVETPKYVLESQLEVAIHRHLSDQGLRFPPVEVVSINDAPYSFAAKLLKAEYVILKQNDDALTDFIERTSEKAMENSFLRAESLREVLEG